MAHIVIRALHKTGTLELLLYVFKNQKQLGSKHLRLTVRSLDGFIKHIQGTIDEIFKSKIASDIKFGDLIILEHTDEKSSITDIKIESDALNLIVLEQLIESIDECSLFYITRNSHMIYFILKNHPVAAYYINGNEVFSDLVYGKQANVLNNICGKIDFHRGVYSTLILK